MTDKEISIVEGQVLWICPCCNFENKGSTDYKCFTRIAFCSECDERVIINTDKEKKTI